MKTRNLLTAGLGFAVLACAGLAGTDGQKRTPSAMASEGKVAPAPPKMAQAHHVLALHANPNGLLQFDPSRAETLRAHDVISLAVAKGRPAELFEVRSFQVPSSGAAWWHLVSKLYYA